MSDRPLPSPLSTPLHHPLPVPPSTRETLPVRHGLRWLRMPLPFALDHINLWLLPDAHEGRIGWSLVDTGVHDAATAAAWDTLTATALQGQPLLRVWVTHFHPDHLGMADALCTQHGCRLWMSASEYQLGRLASQSTLGMGGDAAAAFFASHGLVQPDAQAQIRARGRYYPSMVPRVPSAYRRLMDGQVHPIGEHRWRCLVGHGHSPEHISLYSADAGLLIAGDMLLPRISTNVSVIDVEPEADPLSLYLASLSRLTDLPADTLVLPSHGLPFVGLHTRVAQLHAHHAERLEALRQACREAPRDAASVLTLLFARALDLHQMTFAMGEAIAHLNHLWHAGEVSRSQGTDGIWRFSAR